MVTIVFKQIDYLDIGPMVTVVFKQKEFIYLVTTVFK